MIYNDIIEEIAAKRGLYENIFGKLLDDLIYDQVSENEKNILKNIYGYNDINIIFKKQIQRKEFGKISKIIFRYFGEKEEKTGFFNKKN